MRDESIEEDFDHPWIRDHSYSHPRIIHGFVCSDIHNWIRSIDRNPLDDGCGGFPLNGEVSEMNRRMMEKILIALIAFIVGFLTMVVILGLGGGV